MSTLKELRGRIKTVESTKKITSAMKMVAASRFRKSLDKLEGSRDYAQVFRSLVQKVLASSLDFEDLLVSPSREGKNLVLVFSANRGLCGSYNGANLRYARNLLKTFQSQGKDFEVACIGKRAFDSLSREFRDYLSGWSQEFYFLEDPSPEDAQKISRAIIEGFQEGQYASLTSICGHFRNVLTQQVQEEKLIPFTEKADLGQDILLEPEVSKLIPALLKDYLEAQLYALMRENVTCEQAARMTAMDNATRNAHEMISALRLKYNRTRQAKITTELIEIIAGARALE
jgi:F-type H+-transporting ATPase subunit gamma